MYLNLFKFKNVLKLYPIFYFTDEFGSVFEESEKMKLTNQYNFYISFLWGEPFMF
jgi:hypothetical protein